jgi:hypothetical protein
MGEDPDYISFLEFLGLRRKSHMHQNKPDSVSSPVHSKYKEINPSRANKMNRKRIRHDSSMKEVVIKESVDERARLKPDSGRLRKRRKENKEELIIPHSDGRTYDLDYFNYLSHMKVLEGGIAVEIGGEVIVRYEQEVDTTVQNNRFEEEREYLVGKDMLVQERMQKDGILEAGTRGKTTNKDAVLEGREDGGEIGQMGIASSSFQKSAIQSENDSVIAQVLGLAEVSKISDNKTKSKKQNIGESLRQKTNQNQKKKFDCRQAFHQPEPLNPHVRSLFSFAYGALLYC